jgi:uncharacterized PurR-regulated membrane protein YhhQ (DUF165 family)
MFMDYWKGWKDMVIVNRLLKIFLCGIDTLFVKEINNNLNNKNYESSTF